MFMRMYASSRVKRNSFYTKSELHCCELFCWFPAAMHQNYQQKRLRTKLYKGAWNVSADNSEIVGHKDLRLRKIVYVFVFYNIHFLGFFHWTVSNLFYCCVTVKTIYRELKQQGQRPLRNHHL